MKKLARNLICCSRNINSTNLILNSNFEKCNANWIVSGSATYIANNSHSGNNSMRVPGGGATSQIISSGFNIGQKYKFSVWGKTSEKFKTASITIRLVYQTK